MKKYIVIEESNRKDLEIVVNRHLTLGYAPSGGIATAPQFYCQAMRLTFSGKIKNLFRSNSTNKS